MSINNYECFIVSTIDIKYQVICRMFKMDNITAEVHNARSDVPLRATRDARQIHGRCDLPLRWLTLSNRLYGLYLHICLNIHGYLYDYTCVLVTPLPTSLIEKRFYLVSKRFYQHTNWYFMWQANNEIGRYINSARYDCYDKRTAIIPRSFSNINKILK